MPRISGNIDLTVEDRILLHLLDFIAKRDGAEAPLKITQEGISNGVGISRKHVPRALKKLMSKGLLEEQKTRVSGKPQRMRAYFLTRPGVEEAKNLREHLRDRVVEVIDNRGKNRKMPLMDAKVEGNITLGEAVSKISLDGTLDLRRKRTEDTEKKEQIAEKPAVPLSNDRLSIYRSALEQAWDDGIVTKDERAILERLMVALNVSEEEHFLMEKEILDGTDMQTSDGVSNAYKAALEQALDDGEISGDERAILERIKDHFETD